MPDKTWKAMERRVARMLGGKRIPVSGAAPGFKGDVEHPIFFIECKHGKQIPQIVKKWHTQLKTYPLWWLPIHGHTIPRTIMRWFTKTAEQAKEMEKIPLLVMKPKDSRSDFVLWCIDAVLDYYGFSTLKEFAAKNILSCERAGRNPCKDPQRVV